MNDWQAVLAGTLPWALIRGRSAEVLATFPDNSVDAVAADPPSGISFMGKSWDCFRRAENPADVGRPNVFGRTSRTAPHSYGESERANFVAFITQVMAQAFRVLKPGGHALIWALPRTSHWTAWAVEDAGFEVRDVLDHIFCSGFPKGINISKQLDKKAGVLPVEVREASLGFRNDPQWHALHNQIIMPPPTTPEAQKWEGWNVALKPAKEHWILARKPLEGTVLANVVKWGTGGINIGACRVDYQGKEDAASARPQGQATSKTPNAPGMAGQPDAGRELERVAFEPEENDGRWPAHLLLSHSEWCNRCRACGEEFDYPDNADEMVCTNGHRTSSIGCVEGCPVLELDRQSGERKSGTGAVKRASSKGHVPGALGTESRPEGTPMLSYGDVGGASRCFTQFFYTPKPARSEKEKGCEHLTPKTPEELTGRKTGSAGLVMAHTDGSPKANPYAGTSGAEPRRNHHPTCKSVALMRWLVRLITPPGGVVLDMFAGSGTTGIAALEEGFRFIGIEKDEDKDGNPLGYCDIARARLQHVRPIALNDSVAEAARVDAHLDRVLASIQLVLSPASRYDRSDLANDF
jgi:site-specific DNA-methyltransferase (adenine-specific)